MKIHHLFFALVLLLPIDLSAQAVHNQFVLTNNTIEPYALRRLHS